MAFRDDEVKDITLMLALEREWRNRDRSRDCDYCLESEIIPIPGEECERGICPMCLSMKTWNVGAHCKDFE